eukprot:775940_1
MATLLLIVIQLISVSANYNSWTTVSSPESAKIPIKNDEMAVGYDSVTDTVWLLGGDASLYQLLSYVSNGSFINHGQNVLPRSVWGYSQYYTVMGHALWLIESDGISFSRFDFTTQNFTENYASIIIPQSVSYMACLASFTDVNSNEYLLVNGGSHSAYLKSTNIFNRTSATWIQPGGIPLMQTARGYHSCNVANGMLYSIAGWSGSSYSNAVEIFNISTLSSWNVLTDRLTKAIRIN